MKEGVRIPERDSGRRPSAAISESPEHRDGLSGSDEPRGIAGVRSFSAPLFRRASGPYQDPGRATDDEIAAVVLSARLSG
jgi:hypothetical protein